MKKRWGHLWWFAVIVCAIEFLRSTLKIQNRVNIISMWIHDDINVSYYFYAVHNLLLYIILGKQKSEPTVVVNEYVNYHLQMNTFSWEFEIVWISLEIQNEQRETCTQITPHKWVSERVCACDSKVLFPTINGNEICQLFTTFHSTTTLHMKSNSNSANWHTTGNAFVWNVIFGGVVRSVVLFQFFFLFTHLLWWQRMWMRWQQ